MQYLLLQTSLMLLNNIKYNMYINYSSINIKIETIFNINVFCKRN